MTVTDLDATIRQTIQKALETEAMGEPFSFTAGPTLAPGSTTPVYLVMVSAPSPILGQTMTAPGIITLPVDLDELTRLVGELVSQLRQRASADLGVGFRQARDIPFSGVA
jgi:hypothetical protein